MDTTNQPQPKFGIVENAVSHDIGNMQQPEVFSSDHLSKKGIIHPATTDHEVVHAFRSLRTTLLNKMESHNSMIMVSSVVAGGGASFIARNLAATFAFDHQKTALLIDCNFDDPSVANALDVEAQSGLKDFITGAVSNIESIVYKTSVPRLRIVPVGSAHKEMDSMEFFTGGLMRSFLQEVKSRYSDRVIIIDAPPIIDSADAKILSDLSDYVLLVAPYKGAGAGVINKAVKSVDQEKIIGFVLNN